MHRGHWNLQWLDFIYMHVGCMLLTAKATLLHEDVGHPTQCDLYLLLKYSLPINEFNTALPTCVSAVQKKRVQRKRCQPL
jgi:hypothetical protein